MKTRSYINSYAYNSNKPSIKIYSHPFNDLYFLFYPLALSSPSKTKMKSKPFINYNNNFIPLRKVLMQTMTHLGTSRSQKGFVLIEGNDGTQKKLKWQLITQKKMAETTPYLRETYRDKKSILTSLKRENKLTENFQFGEGFSCKPRTRMVSTSCSTTTLRSVKPYVYANTHSEQIEIPDATFGINQDDLIRRISAAKENSKRVIGLISAKRFGLRYRLNHYFVEFCTCSKSSHEHSMKQMTEQAKDGMKELNGVIKKQLYYFHLNGQPIHNIYRDLHAKEQVILVDSSPKLHLQYDLQIKIIDLSQKIEEQMVMISTYLNSIKPTSQKQLEDQANLEYDWQKIKNVKEYVDKITQNPEYQRSYTPQQKDDLIQWYRQKFEEQKPINKQSDKNLLFETKTHYPNQAQNKKVLQIANQKIEALSTTNNRHKFIPRKIDLMMQHIRKEDELNKKIAQSKVYQPAFTKKEILNRLEKKNSLLISQNIPYMIEKYGLNRFQIYNLYNLYKSFEKISSMRQPSRQSLYNAIEKGIDRDTFDVGLKGLDMNPGDELIKNICHFGDFISWQQFIKIISISLRKTPQQKLTAILKGISSFDDGYLSRHQISIMIGNSLYKLFDSQEKELKEYFTNMAMKQLDSDGKGKIAIQFLKQKVLNKGSDNMNMVSFLILNT